MSQCNQFVAFSGTSPEMHDTTASLQLIVEQLRAELNTTREQLHGEIDRLKTASETLQAAISCAPILLWATDTDGKLTVLEGKKPQNCGLADGEAVGRSIFEIYGSQPDILANIAQVLGGSDRTWNAIQGDLTYEIRSTPLRNSNGEVVGSVGFSTEISDSWRSPAAMQIANQELERQLQRQTEVFKTALFESEKKYQNLLETSQELIWSVDSDRMRSEAALQEATDQLRAVLDAVPGLISWVSSDLRYIGVNQHLAASFKRPPESFVGQEIGFLERGSSFPQLVSNFFESSSQQTWQEIDIEINGSVRNYLIVAQKYHQGNAAVSVGIDITDRKHAEAQKTKLIASLQESEHKFRSLYEATSDAVMLLDEKEFFDCNPATLKIFGCSNKQEFYGKHPSEFSPPFQPNGEDSASLATQRMSTATILGSCRFDWVHKRLDGSEFPAEVLLNAMEINGQKVLQAVVRDITERKRDEDRIKASLAEKEVFLQEIHHRVKNNLQVISSLLKLQSRYIQDSRVIEMLKESQNRVRSMALVHEQLYQSKDLSNIDFAEYIQNLAHNLFQAYEVNTAAGIKLQTNIAPCGLNVDTAVPCGLIINELVTNSLKYAFIDKNQGKIKIDFNLDSNGVCVLVVSDTGVGFPKDLDYRNARTLGLRLVGSLVKQIRGKLVLLETVGTAFEITFPQPKLQQEREINVN